MGSIRVILILALLSGGHVPLVAQDDAFSRGTTGVGLLLRKLDGVKRVLVIGAHPDDEDTSLLATLSRGLGVETAYLSLSRGEGGQNLIGNELDEGLGILRSGELLAARSLDGGRQFFTRAFDFGYSKTVEEALRLWPREEILADVTWVVRTFRPHVIISVFSGTSRDGHGQHQMAGLMAREAFRVAGDPEAFPEQLEAGAALWTPTKLYYRPRFHPQGMITEAFPIGDYDPLLGRSHFQLAMESRSQHRSQDMGSPQPLGPRSANLVLLETSFEGPLPEEEGGIFVGVDTTLMGLATTLEGGVEEKVRSGILAYRNALSRAREELHVLEPWRATEALLDGAASLRRVQEALGDGAGELSWVMAERIPLVEEAAIKSAGVVVDIRLEDDLLVPGEVVGVELEVLNGGPFSLEGLTPLLEIPEGWGVEKVESSGDVLAPGEVATWRYALRIPEGAPPSRPFYMEEPRVGELYRWPQDPSVWGRAANPPLVWGGVQARLGDRGVVSVRSPALFRGVDKATGEFVEPPLVVPVLSVSVDPSSIVLPLARSGPREFTVRVRNEGRTGRSGSVTLQLPVGWEGVPASQPFHFSEAGEEASFSFTVSPPPDLRPGSYVIEAQARTQVGEQYTEEFTLVDYPHIPRGVLFTPARSRVSAFPVSVRGGIRVGYVMGSGDPGPEVLRQLGVPVELLGPEEVRTGDFHRYDAIIMGIRVYETRPDVVAANEAFLDFARDGGTLVVQYNKYEFPAGGFAPYPVEMRRPHDRIADEGAGVEILKPEHPLFRTPNRITEADFRGWAQERGLYFLNGWDAAYTPLLEMTDPGEEPKKGGLLVAPLGEGLYVYTGLAFFRQFPEGVPGAIRLFANLVSLSREGPSGEEKDE
jgi:LmbE family N-acetylglucosaminyl deacetylase